MNNNSNSHALYIKIYNIIKDSITSGQYPPGSILPTEIELSESLEVSRITVRKAMALLTSEGIVSRIAGKGTFVEHEPISTQHPSIGVILNSSLYNFGIDVLAKIDRTAHKNGYSVIFKNSNGSVEEETTFINELVTFGVKGLIIQPADSEFYSETIIKLNMENFPIVLIDSNFSNINISCISTDYFNATKAATEYLFDKGHEKICFMNYDNNNSLIYKNGLNGFVSAYSDRKKSMKDAFIAKDLLSPQDLNNPRTFAHITNKLATFLTKNSSITAIISPDFFATQILIKTLWKLNKSVPDDYSILTFDKCGFFTNNLTTFLSQDLITIGEMAVETLTEKIKDNNCFDKIFVPFSIVEGDTVKTLK